MILLAAKQQNERSQPGQADGKRAILLVGANNRNSRHLLQSGKRKQQNTVRGIVIHNSLSGKHPTSKPMPDNKIQ